MNDLVSIITPIYNVEKYIERCVVSLFEQDFDNIEYIFVNDCTPDNSMQILHQVIERYPNRKSQVKILQNEQNRGTGYTKSRGINSAQGEYFITIDSDDWVELDMISELYKKAKVTDADIVVSDYFRSYEDKEDVYEKEYVLTSNNEDYLFKLFNREITGFLCNKLVKRSLCINNNLNFATKISLLEDYYLMVRLYIFTNNIAYLPKAFLHYWQSNPNATTRIRNEKIWEDIRWYKKETQQFLKEKKIWSRYEDIFYKNLLQRIQWHTTPDNLNKCIKHIMPEFYHTKYGRKYLVADKKHKIKKALYNLHLEPVVRFVISVKNKLLK